MAVDISNAFITSGYNIYNFFQRPGVGFYIPLYQREYSWDKDNIEQLLEDLTKGVERLVDGTSKDDDELRFLGTIITVREPNPNNINPRDTQAIPPSIEKIIDGQQRLSTICMLATVLYKHISLVEKKLSKTDHNDAVKEICDLWRKKLTDIFSVDLGIGKPPRKPQIIRGNQDEWTKDGKPEIKYVSPVSNYLGLFISHIAGLNPEMPKPDRKTNAGENIALMDKWIKDKVINAHTKKSHEMGDFAMGWDIIGVIKEANIWIYERPILKALVLKKDKIDKNSPEYNLASLVQILSVCHYLLDRCCFTSIMPVNDDWAFDMFQSLNATGTPLTALETFKPFVVNVANVEQKASGGFKGSNTEVNFEIIEELFTDLKSANQKNKLTNEFLTSFAIAAKGEKLPTYFSYQKKWLDKAYEELSIYEQKESLIKYLADYAAFYKLIWEDYKGINNQCLPDLLGHPEADLASLLVLFLKESNHKMAITLLSGFYRNILKDKKNEQAKDDFVQAIKLVSAFYAIWRASLSNAGLDNVYRIYFRGDELTQSHAWYDLTGDKELDLNDLTDYLKKSLEKNVIRDGLSLKDSWIEKATSALNYSDAKMISRLALFITSHDTIPDELHLGLMKKGMPNIASYLTVSQWTSLELKEVEHIAPDKGLGVWDANLYDPVTALYDSIGNLTLLPKNVNISASNKGWKEKLVYYNHLTEKDPDKLQNIVDEAMADGITLNVSTIDLLKSVKHSSHIIPIVSLGTNVDWNKEIVEKRTNRILELFWDKLSPWLLNN